LCRLFLGGTFSVTLSRVHLTVIGTGSFESLYTGIEQFSRADVKFVQVGEEMSLFLHHFSVISI
jgi:hypothetical protein